MNKLKCLILGSSLLFETMTATGAEIIREAKINGNVSLGSDYVFRGISQTSENPAIQGGFDFESASGVYAGLWGSNVDFDGSIELDIYAGFSDSLFDRITYDAGLLRYQYPDDEQGGAPQSSFNEFYASVSYSGVTVGVAWSPDYFLESDNATYSYVDYEYALPKEFSLALHYGYQAIDNNARFGTPNYSDFSVGFSRSVADLDLSLTWYDTDLSSSECFGGSDLCESRIVFAIGKSL